MNKKGFAGLTLVLIIIAIVGIGSGSYFGYKYFKDKNQDEFYNGKPIANDKQVSNLQGEGNPDIPDSYAKKYLMRACESLKNKWLSDPIVKVNYLGSIECLTCTEIAPINPDDMYLHKDGFYKNIANCQNEQSDADINIQVEKEEQKQQEKEEILNECPPIWQIEGTPVIRDYLCEIKFKLAQFFQPLIIGLSILLAVIVFLVTYNKLNNLFKKKKQAPMNLVFSIILGLILGGLLYLYFWFAIGVLILYIILISAIPMFVKR